MSITIISLCAEDFLKCMNVSTHDMTSLLKIYVCSKLEIQIKVIPQYPENSIILIISTSDFNALCLNDDRISGLKMSRHSCYGKSYV